MQIEKFGQLFIGSAPFVAEGAAASAKRPLDIQRRSVYRFHLEIYRLQVTLIAHLCRQLSLIGDSLHN
jgi:hypothetical protein